MTTDEIERLLRRPSPGEPTILPDLILPVSAPGPGAVRGRVGSGRTGRSVGLLPPRLVTAVLLLLGALVGAIATGALRLDRLTNPFDLDAVFGGGGISIDYPKDWTRLTPDNPFGSSGANTVLVVSSTGVEGCSEDDIEAYVEPTPYPSSSVDVVEIPPVQDGTIVGLEDRILACAIEQPMAAGEIRIAVTSGMPQAIAVGPIGDFDPDLFFEGDNPEFAFYIPTEEDGWTATIDGMPAKLVVSSASATPGAEEVRTWIVFAPGGNTGPWYVQVTLRGPDLEALRTQAAMIAGSLRFDHHPPALDVATRDIALARAIDAIDRETRLWRGSDLFACFPRAPGATEATIDDLLHEYGPDGALAKAVTVTCTTAVEPTPFETWYATFIVAWEAGDGYEAGEWGWYTGFDANGDPAGSTGQLFRAEELTFPGTVGELPPPLDGPFEIPIGSIVEVLPPGILQTEGPIQAIFADPHPTIGDHVAFDAQPGRRYGVVDGPIAHVGVAWYLVQSRPGTSYVSEYLWLPSSDGVRPLVRVVNPACPDGDPNVVDILRLQPLEAVACFGDRELRLDPAIARLVDDEGNMNEVGGTPEWLARYTAWRLFGAGGPEGLDGGMAIAISPDLGDTIPTGTWLIVRGHFDDAAAESCERSYPAEWNLPPEPRQRTLAECRALFVVTGIEPRSAP